MNIAIATKDGQRIASIRSSPMFRIYHVFNSDILEEFIRKNKYTYHYVRNNNQYYVDQGIDNTTKSPMKGVIHVLEDCSVVIFRNISRKIWCELGELGKELILTDIPEVDEAISLYLSGNLLDKYNSFH